MDQFKTLENLRDYIKEIKGFYSRPTTRGEHSTLYLDQNDGETIHGIRRRDYLFSPCGKFVLPSENMGLSFSAHWQHLKNIYRLKSSRNGGKPVDVCWALEDANLPQGLKFVVDKADKKNRHFFLAVTEKMHVSQLVSKLKWVADRMAVIKDATKAL